VQQDALRHAGTKALELAGVAQEVDDLLELCANLVDACDVGPRDRLPRLRVHLRRLDARHQLEHPREDVEQDDVEGQPEQRPPIDHEVAHGDEKPV